MRKEYNFEFYDDETGEQFIVCLVKYTPEQVMYELRREAIAEAKKYFRTPHCLGYITEFEAEMLGYDTY